jgi:hypothetical protein
MAVGYGRNTLQQHDLGYSIDALESMPFTTDDPPAYSLGYSLKCKVAACPVSAPGRFERGTQLTRSVPRDQLARRHLVFWQSPIQSSSPGRPVQRALLGAVRRHRGARSSGSTTPDVTNAGFCPAPSGRGTSSFQPHAFGADRLCVAFWWSLCGAWARIASNSSAHRPTLALRWSEQSHRRCFLPAEAPAGALESRTQAARPGAISDSFTAVSVSATGATRHSERGRQHTTGARHRAAHSRI